MTDVIPVQRVSHLIPPRSDDTEYIYRITYKARGGSVAIGKPRESVYKVFCLAWGYVAGAPHGNSALIEVADIATMQWARLTTIEWQGRDVVEVPEVWVRGRYRTMDYVPLSVRAIEDKRMTKQRSEMYGDVIPIDRADHDRRETGRLPANNKQRKAQREVLPREDDLYIQARARKSQCTWWWGISGRGRGVVAKCYMCDEELGKYDSRYGHSKTLLESVYRHRNWHLAKLTAAAESTTTMKGQ